MSRFAISKYDIVIWISLPNVNQIVHIFDISVFTISYLIYYSNTCVKQSLKKRQNKNLNDKW